MSKDTPAMSKVKRLIPELRFPEFEGEGEWVKMKLGQIGEPLMCKRIFKNQTKPDSENGIPFYKIGTFGREPDSYISTDLFHEYISKYNFPKKGDILISASGTIGRLVIYDGKPAYFQDSNIVWLGNGEKVISNEFLYHCYSTVKWQTSDGGVIKRLYNSDLKDISIRLPKNGKEQQKIAACLSSLDDLITAHRDKLDALKDHKKGLMQQLFPGERESVPQVRFPEFEEEGEWEEKKLGEVCSMRAGKFVRASGIKVKFADGTFPCYGGNGLRGYTESYTHSGKYSLIGRQGALCGNVNLVSGQFHATEHAVVVEPEDNVDTDWLYYTLVLLHLNQYATGQAQPGLSVSNLELVELKISRNSQEQQKIASALSAVDELIAAQQEKIAQLQEHKKGLMQGLFPSPSTD